MLKKLALVAALALGSATAHADSITIGYWDQANGLNSPIIPIITMPSFDLFTLNGQSFGTMHGVLSGLRTVGGNYEVAINNIFSTGPGTVRIYATFSGVLAPPGGARFHFSSLFQRTEDPLPGWTVAEQIFVCAQQQPVLRQLSQPDRDHGGQSPFHQRCQRQRLHRFGAQLPAGSAVLNHGGFPPCVTRSRGAHCRRDLDAAL